MIDEPSKAEKLAAALLADRVKTKIERNDIAPCFSCGVTFISKGRRGDLNGRFCSMRCQEWFDDGNPSFEQRKLKGDLYGIIGWKVVAGPPGIEIGADYYKPLRDAVERRKAKIKPKSRKTRNKVPNYTVKANGHGYWQPGAASRALGFTSIDCGFDGEDARSKATALNDAASAARKSQVGAENINREAA